MGQKFIKEELKGLEILGGISKASKDAQMTNN